MRALLPKLRLLLGSLTTLFLVSCTVSDAVTPPPEGINTLNIFFDNNKIYSVNADTGIAIERASFDSTTEAQTLTNNIFLPQQTFSNGGMALSLNTDEGKQGFEYVAYLDQGSLYLLDYVTASRTFITNISGPICGIAPRFKASKFAFTDLRKSNRSLVNLPSIVVAYPNGTDCSQENNFLDLVDFSTLIDSDTGNDQATRQSFDKALFYGARIIDYTSGTVNTDGIVANAKTGFLGYSTDSGILQFEYQDNDTFDSWQTLLPYFNSLPSIWQISNSLTLVQVDDKIYIIPIKTLFDINNSNEDSTAIQSRIDALFSAPSKILPNSNTVTISETPNLNSLLIKQGNTLLYYDNGVFSDISVGIETNVIDVKFALISDSKAVVLKEFSGSSVLILIDTQTGSAITLIPSAEKIEFEIKDNELYVNIYKQASSGDWQAQFYDLNSIKTTYENSRFLFFSDGRHESNTIYLLSSDLVEQADFSQKKLLSIYDFNPSEIDGRRKVRLNNSNLGFSFGTLQINVNSTLSSTIINDIYGYIKFDGATTNNNVSSNVINSYLFVPSQQEDNSVKQNLKLINLP